MNDFIDYVLGQMTGHIDDRAFDRLSAVLSHGDKIHKEALRQLMPRLSQASYNDGYQAGYMAGKHDGFSEGEEAGFYEASTKGGFID